MAKAPEKFETIAEMEAEARPGRRGRAPRRRQPDGPLRPLGPAPLQRPRRGQGRRPDDVPAADLRRGLGAARRRRSSSPGSGQDIIKAVGKPGRLDLRPAPFADDAPRPDLLALARPGALRPAASGPLRAEAGHADGPGPRPRRSRSTGSWSPATRSRPRSTSSSPASSPTRAPRRPGHPRSASRHRDLEHRASSTGASSRAPRWPRTTPTRWSSSSAPTRAIRCPGPTASR